MKHNWGNEKEHTVQLHFSDLPRSDLSRSLPQTKFALEQLKFKETLCTMTGMNVERKERLNNVYTSKTIGS